MKTEPRTLDYFNALRRAYRQHQARKKLQLIIDERRDSYECRRFRERRAAALKATRQLETAT